MIDRRVEDRTALRAHVAAAARIVTPVWPIGTFVAVNPLGGLLDRPFEEAVAEARRALGIRGLPSAADLRAALAEHRVTHADVVAAIRDRHPGLPEEVVEELAAAAAHDDAPEPAGAAPRTIAERADALLGGAIAATADEETAKWCAVFVDEEATWALPGRERGFYAAWRDVAARGPALRRLAPPGVRERVADLPERAEDAVLHALGRLRVPADRRVAELRGHFGRLPGWASLALYFEREGRAGLDPVELLAVQLTYDAELLEAAAGREGASLHDLLERLGPPPATAEDDVELGAIRLAALESAYADRLLEALTRPAPAPRSTRPAAQAVFCIDVRSEGLRRHLEAQGDFETLGFAGFFAVAMRFRALGAPDSAPRAPVLLDPRDIVAEVPAGEGADRWLGARRAAAGAEHGLHAAKAGTASPFALAELGGWAAGPVAAARTLGAGPLAALRRRLGRAASGGIDTTLDLDTALPIGEQALIARTALTMMGLTSGFGRLVLLCGHGALTTNNPHAAALNCGACGGHEGGPNARAAALILNRPEVRAQLAGAGIDIPADTWFLPGRHDTTSDRVEILDRHLVPATHADDVASLERALAAAGAANAAERLRALPEVSGSVEERGVDWAQVRPEWGLARNAAFLIGPRTMTQGIDLDRRTFLHSYDHRVDPDGTLLETILTAPLVVAQWINAQYLFSTTDPEILGAGDKTLHNVVGGIGVLQGAGGDLRIGLPRQACFAGDRPYHEPLRLLAVVQAPLARIDELVARNEILRQFFDGRWVGLVAREDAEEPWRRRGPGGAWSAWTPGGAVAEAVPEAQRAALKLVTA
jgi:hypothetical protein